MKLSYLFIAFLAVNLTGCGDNPTPPAVQDISLDDNSTVSAGTVLKVAVSYRVDAQKTDSVYSGGGFSSVISIPIGATYNEGSSEILFQSQRAPDEKGLCPDGRTYLVYNFGPNEFEDPDSFDPFIGVIDFNVTLQTAADNRELIASASSLPPSDPCAPIEGESVEFSVEEE